MLEILDFFQKNLAEILYQNIGEDYQELEEIRIRVEKPIILKFSNKEIVIPNIITRRRNNKNFTKDM